MLEAGMAEVNQRAVLERLIEERREDYAGLSRLIGRNAAYIQQFVKRGVPRQLAERDRRTLARYFNVPDEALGGPAPLLAAGGAIVSVPRLDVQASAGGGATADGETVSGTVAFDRTWLRRIPGVRAADLSIITVTGDSMTPTLVDGDDILVDRGDADERLRDGLYVLRRDDALLVKRLAVSPATRLISVRSDNPAYPVWADCEPQSLAIVGRVVWAGRRFA
jgi:phage repressor protein C with HTH and peptisase S24 domain